MANTTNEAVTNSNTGLSALNDTSTLSVVDGAYTAAAATALTATLVENRPQINLALTVTFASAVAAAGKTVDVYYRYINIDGTNDEPVPGTDAYFAGHYRGSFQLGDDVTQYIKLFGVLAPVEGEEVEVYLENNSGQTINAWKLTVLPWSLLPYAA